jgi:hypothetical protein
VRINSGIDQYPIPAAGLDSFTYPTSPDDCRRSTLPPVARVVKQNWRPAPNPASDTLRTGPLRAGNGRPEWTRLVSHRVHRPAPADLRRDRVLDHPLLAELGTATPKPVVAAPGVP